MLVVLPKLAHIHRPVSVLQFWQFFAPATPKEARAKVLVSGGPGGVRLMLEAGGLDLDGLRIYVIYLTCHFIFQVLTTLSLTSLMARTLLVFMPGILLDLADLATALAIIQKFNRLLVPISGVLDLFKVFLLVHVGDDNLIIAVKS